jgi:hypothetical protein
MEFRDYATEKTSALVGRLLAGWSEKSLRELQALRQALDAAAQSAEAALARADATEQDRTIAALVDELTRQAKAQVDAAVQQASSQAEAAAQKAKALADAALQQAQRDAQAKIDQLEKDQQQQAKKHAQLAVSLDQMRSAAEALRAELKAEKDRTAAVRDELNKAHESHGLAEAAHKKAEAALQKAARDKDREMSEAHAALEALRAESATVTRHLEIEAAERAKLAVTLATTQKQLQGAEGQRQTLGQEIAAATERIRELESLLADQQSTGGGTDAAAQIQALQEQVAQAETVPLDRLLAALKQLAAGKTVPDVLSALVGGIAQEFTRVALFNVTGGQLEGVRQIGFDFKSDISKIVVPLNIDSMFSRAVKSGRIQGFSSNELTDTNRAPFGGTPSFALVLPIVIARQVAAVLYADDSGEKPEKTVAPERRVKFVHLLLWYVTPMLPRLMVQQDLEELKEYAGLLVNELEGMHTADRKAGQAEDALKRRLAESLQYARQKYAQRAEGRNPAAASLLEQQLAAAIKNKSGSPFGRDLSAAIARSAKSTGRQAAEA